MGEVIDRYSDDNATEAAFLIFLTLKRVQYVVTITHRAVIRPNALSSAPEMVVTIVILLPSNKHTCLSDNCRDHRLRHERNHCIKACKPAQSSPHQADACCQEPKPQPQPPQNCCHAYLILQRHGECWTRLPVYFRQRVRHRRDRGLDPWPERRDHHHDLGRRGQLPFGGGT